MPKLEKTATEGVFRRHRATCSRRGRCDCAYVAVYRERGKQRTETCRTYSEARELKRTRETQVASGEFSAASRITLRQYVLEWIERYQGTGRRGFREETREEYRGLLNKYALKYFPPNTKLTEVDPKTIADFIGWLCKRPNRRGGVLSDKSVRNAFIPLSSCLATARREGLIRHDPCSKAALPHREVIEEDEDKARPFPVIVVDDEIVQTMELVVELVRSDHRLLFELIAATGMRRSEALALEARHFALAGATPHLKVRQRVRRQKGRGLVVGPLKSRHARRNLPLPHDLAERIALKIAQLQPRDLVFQSKTGSILDPDNLADRVLAPACKAAGVPWAGFHTFRHTVASRLFAENRNVVQVQKWLGHHSPSFTLDTYVHLFDEDLGDPLVLLPARTGRDDDSRSPRLARAA